MIQQLNTDTTTQTKTLYLWPESNRNTALNNADSVKGNAKKITQTFIQDKPVDIDIKPVQKNYNDWMIYVLLILIFFISLIWYYLPERAFSLIKFTDKNREFRGRENVNTETPGTLILLFFIMNYFVTLSLFLFLATTNKHLTPDHLLNNEYILFFFASVIAFYLYRLLVITVTGFIFNTKDVAVKQVKLYVNADNLSGVLLIPLLFLMLFIHFKILIYAGIFILMAFQIFKWIQSFILGKTISGFSILHLFMYLCTLEIIPLIVLIKLFYIVFN